MLGRRRRPAADRDALVGVAVGQLGADLLELRPPPGPSRRQGGLDRDQGRREVGVGPLPEDGQPAVGRAVEPPLLEVEVAQAVGRVVADRGEEIGRVDASRAFFSSVAPSASSSSFFASAS